MSFPLFAAPGSVVFLDDDPDYLDMLQLLAPPAWPVRFFLRPDQCLQQIQRESADWEADVWAQQEVIDRWHRHGTPLIPQILRYWAEHGARRYGLTQVCVVDYSMPQTDGLQVLETLRDWPGAKVLLTGQADEQMAVQAFNRGLIAQFIPKQSPDIARQLVHTVAQLLASACQRQAALWRATLTPVQNALLRTPSIAQALARWVAVRNWVEYVVIGAPFGILGRDAQGVAGWLQLEPYSGLDELAELADGVGASAVAVDAIRRGQQLMAIELCQALGLTSTPLMAPAFAVGEDDSLLGAQFDVPTEVTHGFAQWLDAQPPRRTQN
ncbi:response regulator [Rhodoferax sp.]|uniref:response regulator n=1 Tax=Rhodoferax sp. TaxID=50421 RepID=UPI00374D6B4E